MIAAQLRTRYEPKNKPSAVNRTDAIWLGVNGCSSPKWWRYCVGEGQPDQRMKSTNEGWMTFAEADNAAW